LSASSGDELADEEAFDGGRGQSVTSGNLLEQARIGQRVGLDPLAQGGELQQCRRQAP
jgi:hypothetical protein